MDKMDFTAEYRGKTSHTSVTKELIDDLKMIQCLRCRGRIDEYHCRRIITSMEG